MKRIAPEPELCHFYDGSAALVFSSAPVGTVSQLEKHCYRLPCSHVHGKQINRIWSRVIMTAASSCMHTLIDNNFI